MNPLNMVRILLLEMSAETSCCRIAEPDLIMERPQAVEDYLKASHCGPLSGAYLYHLVQLSRLIRPGDTVVDLGCGPATHLIQQAQLFPGANFIGIDLSTEMLNKATRQITESRLSNIKLIRGDILSISKLDIPPPDLIQSCWCFHHLPDQEALQRALREIQLVMKPDTALYLFDFARLKTQRSMFFLADLSKNQLDDYVARDYLNSLQAAFSLVEFESAITPLGWDAKCSLFTMRFIPALILIKSHDRITPSKELTQAIHKLRGGLSWFQYGTYLQLKLGFKKVY